MTDAILTINAGSSTVKFSLYDNNLQLLYTAVVDDILNKALLKIYDLQKNTVLKKNLDKSGYEFGISSFLEWIEQQVHFHISAVGHRIVHGGKQYSHPIVLNKNILRELKKYIPLAPLHQGPNLTAIELLISLKPNLTQIGCFDTAFHRTQLPLAQTFAIAKEYTDEGIIRYGFHGLSYEYIAEQLPKLIGEKAKGKIIVAHLGNGASMCAMQDLKSVATSMGFTALDGLMMGTRCGSIDPGVLLYFLQEKQFSVDQLNDMLYKKSGLLGVSGISSDVRELSTSTSPQAASALDLFCYRAARELMSLLAPLQGLDYLVFTAGIGENSSLVREKLCRWIHWLGIEIDHEANKNNRQIISTLKSKIGVLVIPTDEEKRIAEQTKKMTPSPHEKR